MNREEFAAILDSHAGVAEGVNGLFQWIALGRRIMQFLDEHPELLPLAKAIYSFIAEEIKNLEQAGA